MKTKFQYILLLILMATSSCIDRFPLEGGSYENLLVVDGLLHSGEGPYTVQLSRSSSVSDPVYLPVEDAAVKILDDQGQVEVLQEIQNGEYQTDTNGIRGISGRSYRMEIILKNGQTYASPYIRLNDPVSIDTVYPSFEIFPTIDPETNLQGYRFYVNTGEASVDTAYYLWHLTETYKYTAAFMISYTYDRFTEPYLKPIYHKDSLYYCFETEEVPFFQVETTAGKTSAELNSVPLHYVTTNTNRLSIRYSLLTKQYSVNAETYKYWNAVKEQLNNDDLLFNRQAYQIRGNVSNMNDPSEPVMGYFTVGGLYSKRIFVDRPEGVDVFEAECAFIEPMELILTRPQEWPLFLGPKPGGGFGLAEKPCFDCRWKGGVLEKPPFWTEAEKSNIVKRMLKQ